MRLDILHINPRANLRALIVVIIGVMILAAAVFFYTFPARQTQHACPTTASSLQKPSNLLELLQSGDGAIAMCDIALLNLLCAQGLPGAEAANPAECLATLDRWVHRIRSETDRHLYRYKANPAEFDHSEAYFRMLIMSVVLYEDYGVRYNPSRISAPADIHANDHFFADSRDIFLHGLLGPARDLQPSTLKPLARHSGATAAQPPTSSLGTCSSMPVLYIALGRRLGYPLKLVTTKAHLFLRWDSPTERFDMEATGKGMNRYDHEHFKHWPYPVTEDEIKRDGYLKSLTPAEELAVFLSLRGHCLREAGQAQEAACAYREAVRLVPAARAYRLLLAETLGRLPDLPPTNASPSISHIAPGLLPGATATMPRPEPDLDPASGARASPQ